VRHAARRLRSPAPSLRHAVLPPGGEEAEREEAGEAEEDAEDAEDEDYDDDDERPLCKRLARRDGEPPGGVRAVGGCHVPPLPSSRRVISWVRVEGRAAGRERER